jgi:hypothetical protein
MFHARSLGRPTLAHETEQMGQGLIIGTVSFPGQLAGTFVELRGHFSGFVLGTTQGNKNAGEFG